MKLKKFLIFFSILSIVYLNIAIISNITFFKHDIKVKTESNLSISANNNLHFHYWHKKWDNGYRNEGNGICVNENDSIYIAGSSYDHTSGKSEAHIIQYDKSGNKLWEHTWNEQDFTSITIDNHSNLYVAGIKYTPDALGERDFLLFKFNSSKQEEWKKVWDITDYDRLNGITLDSSGNIYVVGESENLVILQKYTTNGTLVWGQTWIEYSSYITGKVAVDSEDNIYVSGNANSDQDIYLVKYNSSGSLIWYKTFGTTNLREITFDITLDHNDSIYVCGNIVNHPSPEPGTYDHEVFIAKFNNSGHQIWNRTWGGSGDDYGMGINVDSKGNIYTTGWTTSFGYVDLYVLKYNSEGIKQWSNVLDFSVTDRGYDIVLDSLDDIYVVGNTFNMQNRDILVVKLGSIPPSSQIPGYESAIIIGIAGLTIIVLKRRSKKKI